MGGKRRATTGGASAADKKKKKKRGGAATTSSGGESSTTTSVAVSSPSKSTASSSASPSKATKESKQHHEHRQWPSATPSTKPVDARKGYLLPLKKINQHITCFICKGYLVEATTVIECLHTFCKSCLLAHFEEGSVNCPKCDQLIHQSHPTHYVAFDRTMQDIVYKLVPGLHNEEQQRRKEYKAAKRKAAGIEEVEERQEKEEEKGTNRCFPDVPPKHSHHRSDDQIVVRLIPEKGLEPIARPVIRTSHQTTVNTLKRYLAKMYWNDTSRYAQLDIFCNGELMGKDYSMRFIQFTQWRHHKPSTPLALTYRPHIEY